MVVESGENVEILSYPKVFRCAPLIASHRNIMLLDPDTIYVPSRENATDVIGAECL